MENKAITLHMTEKELEAILDVFIVSDMTPRQASEIFVDAMLNFAFGED